MLKRRHRVVCVVSFKNCEHLIEEMVPEGLEVRFINHPRERERERERRGSNICVYPLEQLNFVATIGFDDTLPDQDQALEQLVSDLKYGAAIVCSCA